MIKIANKLSKKYSKPWSYATYMEVALYDNEVGYYTNENLKLGKEGDFYTSNHVHPVFQKTFARFMADVIIKEDIPAAICEWGAGDGLFAYNVLTYLKEKEPTIFERLEYIIIEASTYHQKVLKNKLEEYLDKVVIFSDLEEASKTYEVFEGIVFSNELIDAFPVHVIKKEDGKLYEVMIDAKDDHLHEVQVPCTNEKLIQWMKKYGPEIQAQRFEVCLPMREWLIEVGKWIKKGTVITVDYGYSNEEWLSHQHNEGSLRGYYKHQLIKNPLDYPGEMDLTTHIQWDAFNQIAEENNFSTIFHDRQDRFLLKAGLFTFLLEAQDLNPFSKNYKQNRAIQSLVHPGGISSSFHVNIQGKGLSNTNEYLFFNENPYQI